MLSFNVEKKIGGIQLKGKLNIPKGELLVILGPSGCGKTTLLNLIAGFKEPDSGEISFHGRTLYNREEGTNENINKRGVGYIQQESCLFPHLKVRENILYSIPKKQRNEVEEYYRSLMSILEIESLEGESISSLSGGQQQRVSIARTLMNKPQMILWDEPFSALDHVIRKELRRLVQKIRGNRECPMIFVTHDLQEAFELSDRIAVMSEGEILQVGTKDELIKNPKNEKVEKILGICSKGKKEPPVIAISGVSNSGKTTVMIELIKGLKERGYSLGTIKHDGHGFEMDHEGKDTYRHREAGADGVIISSRAQYAMIQRTPKEEVALETLIKLHSQHDIILLEGFKFSPYPKVEVVRKERSSQCVCDRNTLLAVMTDVDMDTDGIPKFHLSDKEGLLEFIHGIVKEYYNEG